MKISNLKLYSLFTILLVSCEPEISEFVPNAGNADFSVFISVGCSQTAGFANNELYRSGQIVSIPNILSRQLLHVGGGEFRQPLMGDDVGYGNRLQLEYITDCLGDSVIQTVEAGGMPDEGSLGNIYATEGPFQNLGVPGAKISQFFDPLNTTSGAFYKFFSRFASSPEASILSDAVASDATFFSFWAGKSDILDFAMSGGTASPIIEPEQFRSYLTILLTQLRGMTMLGVVANIPEVLSYPYFTHINPEGLWVVDTTEINGKRTTVAGELILLPAAEQIKCQNLGSEENPVPMHWHISIDQVNIINSRINSFNAIISERASHYNLAFADIHSLFSEVREGVVVDGVSINFEFIFGGYFSLDGINTSRRGNALLANAFIDAINKRYIAAVPRVSITQFQGIEYP